MNHKAGQVWCTFCTKDQIFHFIVLVVVIGEFTDDLGDALHAEGRIKQILTGSDERIRFAAFTEAGHALSDHAVLVAGVLQGSKNQSAPGRRIFNSDTDDFLWFHTLTKPMALDRRDQSSSIQIGKQWGIHHYFGTFNAIVEVAHRLFTDLENGRFDITNHALHLSVNPGNLIRPEHGVVQIFGIACQVVVIAQQDDLHLKLLESVQTLQVTCGIGQPGGESKCAKAQAGTELTCTTTQPECGQLMTRDEEVVLLHVLDAINELTSLIFPQYETQVRTNKVFTPNTLYRNGMRKIGNLVFRGIRPCDEQRMEPANGKDAKRVLTSGVQIVGNNRLFNGNNDTTSIERRADGGRIAIGV